MKSSKLHLPVLFAAVYFCAGCGDDPVRTPATTQFAGDWVVVSQLSQKMPCAVDLFGETQLHELRIDQSGSVASLSLGDFDLAGQVRDQHLHATGNGQGSALALMLTRSGQSLQGELQIDGGCTQTHALEAIRRVPDANYSGHWKFDLRVVGADGCDHLGDYMDCFRILQSGSELLVVDDEKGNLHGKVIGNLARIERDSAEEQTTLLFRMDVSKQQLSGQAVRIFSEQECRSDLSFTGWRSDLPCAQHDD